MKENDGRSLGSATFPENSDAYNLQGAENKMQISVQSRKRCSYYYYRNTYQKGLGILYKQTSYSKYLNVLFTNFLDSNSCTSASRAETVNSFERNEEVMFQQPEMILTENMFWTGNNFTGHI